MTAFSAPPPCVPGPHPPRAAACDPRRGLASARRSRPTPARRETHVMVEKTIELTGTSTNSIEDAVGLAVIARHRHHQGHQARGGDRPHHRRGGGRRQSRPGGCGSASASRCRSSSTSSMGDAAKTREVADGVVQVFLPLPMRPTIVNVYLVRGGDGWTLVDTGMHTGDSRPRSAARSARSASGRPTSAASSARTTTSTTTAPRPAARADARDVCHLHPLEAERAAAAHDVLGEQPEFLRAPRHPGGFARPADAAA